MCVFALCQSRQGIVTILLSSGRMLAAVKSNAMPGPHGAFGFGFGLGVAFAFAFARRHGESRSSRRLDGHWSCGEADKGGVVELLVLGALDQPRVLHLA